MRGVKREYFTSQGEPAGVRPGGDAGDAVRRGPLDADASGGAGGRVRVGVVGGDGNEQVSDASAGLGRGGHAAARHRLFAAVGRGVHRAAHGAAGPRGPVRQLVLAQRGRRLARAADQPEGDRPRRPRGLPRPAQGAERDRRHLEDRLEMRRGVVCAFDFQQEIRLVQQHVESQARGEHFAHHRHVGAGVEQKLQVVPTRPRREGASITPINGSL